MPKNKKTNGCLITVWTLIGIIFVLILTCVISILIPENPIAIASSMIRSDLPKGTAIVNDDYDGPSFPLGDGYTWIVLQIPAEEISRFKNSLAETPYWKSLPLPTELAENERYLQPSFFGVNETIPIDTSTGYYLFIDHQEEYNKAQKRQAYDTSIPFYKRASLNYTFGLFNDKDGRLYLLRFDT